MDVHAWLVTPPTWFLSSLALLPETDAAACPKKIRWWTGISAHFSAWIFCTIRKLLFNVLSRLPQYLHIAAFLSNYSLIVSPFNTSPLCNPAQLLPVSLSCLKLPRKQIDWYGLGSFTQSCRNQPVSEGRMPNDFQQITVLLILFPRFEPYCFLLSNFLMVWVVTLPFFLLKNFPGKDVKTKIVDIFPSSSRESPLRFFPQ